MSGGGRSRTSSSQQSQSQSTFTPAGQAGALDVFGDVQAQDFGGQATQLGNQSYSGPRIATPNYTQGISLGQGANTANQTMMAGGADALQNFWDTTVSGYGENPNLSQVIGGFTTDWDEAQARLRGQRALYAGAEGAFGGTPYQQGETWADEQAGQTYANTVAGLRFQDFNRWLDQMAQAPGAYQQIADLRTRPSDDAFDLADRQAAQDQAGFSNAAAVSDAQWENFLRELGVYDQLMGMAAGIPGGTSTTSGTATGQSTTRTREPLPWGDIIQGIASVAGAAIMSSDRRIKKNLEQIDDYDGVKWYEFHYVWEPDDSPKHVGVIAQELQEVMPEAVEDQYGLLVVNYRMLLGDEPTLLRKVGEYTYGRLASYDRRNGPADLARFGDRSRAP